MKAGYVRELDDAAIETATRYHQEATSPASEIHFHHFGGAVARVDEDATAYRRAPGAVRAERHRGVARRGGLRLARRLGAAALRRHRALADGGAYINFLSAEGEDRVRAAYGEEKFARLQALKDEYDPTNLFHLNQNIPPSGG